MMTFVAKTDTRNVMRIVRMLLPLVWLRLMSPAFAARIAVKFAKIEVRPK